MQSLSYIEVNVICLMLLGIFYIRVSKNRSILTTSQIIMKRVILASCILCMSDIVAVICRGQTFAGARGLIEASNLIYIYSMPVISMFWNDYVRNRLGKRLTTMQTIMHHIPLGLFTLVAISNPFTNYLFTIDENNLYARGPGIFLHWIVAWFYLASATIISYKAYKSADNWIKRAEYRPLLAFLIFPIIGCLVQMLLYGVSSVQAGITLSILLVNIQLQANQVSTDELTGINNRKEMANYLDSLWSRKPSLCVMMIDVNRFKSINDTFGHAAGDEALKKVANALKRVCEKCDEHLFLCRYGGDEFVIIGEGIDNDRALEIKSIISDEIKNTTNTYGYTLSVSVGYSIDPCSNEDEFEKCIKQADLYMYKEKAINR